MSNQKPAKPEPLPQTWLWDARPLEDNSWGSVYGFDDGLGGGDFIDMRLWLRPQARAMTNEPPIYRPAHAPLPPLYDDGGVRRCYIPSEEDLELVRRAYPEHRNPHVPPWLRIEADLVASGRSRDELLNLNAPALLRLLPGARAVSVPKKRGRKPDTDAKADAKIVEAWNTGRYRTHEELARELGIDARYVRLAKDRQRARDARRGVK
ncbi:MAG TPA: hypothetical protein PKC49_01285 [Phycisphaerae bacterium]|nr:hypothetical protein [Phycisphaerae bacterium]